jgi:hypothetical protein
MVYIVYAEDLWVCRYCGRDYYESDKEMLKYQDGFCFGCHLDLSREITNINLQKFYYGKPQALPLHI